jgi:GH15 family glucan-1,4-alpha-glucosidase
LSEGLPPLRRIDGYLPLEDHGLVGDGSSAALIGRDGAVSWLCVPRFDSPPLLCGLLDTRRGGHFRIALDGLTGGRQYYEPDTGVLVTELQSANALLRVTDAMTFVDGASLLDEREMARGELLRKIEVLRGPASFDIVLTPREGLTDPGVHLDSNLPLTGWSTAVTLDEGAVAWVALRWRSQSEPATFDDVMERTRRAWQTWSTYLQYEGPQRALVRRSALTLKLLD